MSSLFDLTGRVCVVTGATGALAGSAACYLAGQGVRVAFVGRSRAKLDAALDRCRAAVAAGGAGGAGEAAVMGIEADVADRQALQAGCDAVLARWGRIDGLLNGAGGNMPGATITPDKSFFDLDFEAFQQVVDLNLHGTVLPTLVFAKAMAEGGGAGSGKGASGGSIINYSSAAAPQAITRVVGYSAAKSAVDNFTRWLAVDLARKTRGAVRVNALMPGFFIGEQNRRLLTNDDATPTDRGRLIMQNTPFGRFGEADELHGAVHYLLADASRFVTGTILAVDGGFGAFSGV